MTPLSKVFILEASVKLNFDNMLSIYRSGCQTFFITSIHLSSVWKTPCWGPTDKPRVDNVPAFGCSRTTLYTLFMQDGVETDHPDDLTTYA